MSTSDSLALLVGLASSIGTCLAALAAFRSAAAAKEAQAGLFEFEARARRHQVVSLLGEIRRERDQGEFLVRTLRILYRHNALFSGNLSSSRVALKSSSLDAMERRLLDEITVIEPFDNAPMILINLPVEDIERLIHSFTLSVSAAHSVNDELSRERQSQELQLLQNRESQLSKLT